MQRIYEDINTMNSIAKAMETAQTMGTTISRSDILTEVELVRTRIKNSCKRLMDLMTDEEMSKLDVAPVIKMFGENIKPDIVKLLRR